MSNPADLNVVPQPDTDKNYFNFKATGLKIDQTYAIKFQWVYSDGEVSDWSPGYFILTSNETSPAVPSSASVPENAIGSIPVTLSVFPTNARRVDVIITGGVFGTSKIAYSFTAAGTTTIAAPAGTYQVQLRSISPTGVTSSVGTTFTIVISDAGEIIQSPTNPNGFSIDRVLGGIQVNWAGTYSNGTFTGFEAIKIYVGSSATATVGSYKDAGVMTGNNVANSITIPVDGVYLRYDLPVYIHAAAINKSGTVGTLQVNVANNSLGARSAIGSDLADLIITNAKLVADSVTSTKIATGAITEIKIATDAITNAKIAAGAITETKISSDAVTSAKIVAGAISAGKIAAGAVTTEKLDALSITAEKIAANAITSDKIIANAITAGKIDALAITSDKIAANAITASKVLAGEIDVTKLAAGTISVNNLAAGTITSTSYIRAGSKNITTGLGARVEISSAAIEDGTVDIAAGLHIYNSSGVAVLSAPLNGGLTIVGSGTFTGSLEIGNGNNIFKADPSIGIWLGNTTFALADFRVSTTGILTALAGNIGGWKINSQALKSSEVAFPNIQLDPVSSKIELRATAGNGPSEPSGNYIKMDTAAGLRIGSGATPSFTVAMAGNMSATNGTFSSGFFTGNITSSAIITGGTFRTAASGNRIEISSSNIIFYNTTYPEFGSISVNSDGIYFKPPGSTYNAFAIWGPNGAIPNGASFLNQVRLTQSEENSFTTADLGNHRLRNMIVSDSDPSLSSGGAGTSGGYGSIWLTRES